MGARIEESETISDSAVIHPLATFTDSVVAANTVVWQNAAIIRGATIGEYCQIGHGAIVDGCPLGDWVLVGSHAAINPGTKVGSNVFIGPRVVTCNDYAPEVSAIGFDQDALFDGKWTVIIDSNASIGAGAIILPGVRIGQAALVAAGAVVDRDVPAKALFRRDGSIVENYERPARMRYAL